MVKTVGQLWVSITRRGGWEDLRENPKRKWYARDQSNSAKSCFFRQKHSNIPEVWSPWSWEAMPKINSTLGQKLILAEASTQDSAESSEVIPLGKRFSMLWPKWWLTINDQSSCWLHYPSTVLEQHRARTGQQEPVIKTHRTLRLTRAFPKDNLTQLLTLWLGGRPISPTHYCSSCRWWPVSHHCREISVSLQRQT